MRRCGRTTTAVGHAVLVVLPALGTYAGTAGAQTGDPAAAAELFTEGRASLLAKDYDVACAKLTESARFDPKVGTFINLAQCERARGNLAAALRGWDEALTLAHDTGDTREAYVAQQRSKLAQSVPTIRLRLGPGAPPATVVSMDQVAIPVGRSLQALPVDPGNHVVTATAEGRASQSFTVALHEGESTDLVVEPGPAPVSATPVEPTKPSSFWSPQRTLAAAAAGLGVAGAGVASVFGVQAINARNEPGCTGGVCDTSAEAQVQRDGVTAGNRATLVFIGSGVLVAAGAVLWLTAPKASRGAAAPSVGLSATSGGAALDVRGLF